MKATINDIIIEKKYCCENVQKTVNKYCNIAISDMLIRNLLQIELKDELNPMNEDKFFIEFAKQYTECKNVKQCKKNLIELFGYNDNRDRNR